ncbi:probable carboxylesterase 15 [Cajanus cajan]|uniref:Gibberellin receptor GID1L3 n=1 Tax=Cajanus cajan TaxID=3821 RepID=A0A151QU18_CAJCA|nr:probable carboxylesterase 15 [Cajanus cajan]KYP33775.1 putative gibberellin receptor GID1L3 [Cajanus cajan]
MVQEKKLVEEVSGWLRLYDDGSVDRTWTGPSEVKFMVESVPPHEEFINGVVTRDVIMSDKLRVRLYLPEIISNEEKLPIFLHFHGGGFCISEPDWFMYYQFYTRLAQLARVIVVSPFLRRAPENRLPAAIDDGFSALIWLQSVVKRNAEEPWLEKYGDFNRVFLIGDSSGANIVHEVATRAGRTRLDPLRLIGGIPIHPGFSRPKRSRSELEKPESPFLTLDMVDKFMNLALPLGSNKDHPISCPMGDSAPPLSGLKLPPFLLCLAEMDLIFDTEMEYYEAMRKANKEVELFVSKGVTHSFYLNKIAVDMDPNTGAQRDALIARIKEFIEQH